MQSYTREMTMPESQALETNRELNITGTDHVLDLEIRKLGLETELLNNSSVFTGCKLGLFLALGAGNNLKVRLPKQPFKLIPSCH